MRDTIPDEVVYNFAKVQLSGMIWMPSHVEKRGIDDREWTYEK